MSEPPRGRYARVPYPAFPHAAGDPDRLAMIAHLHDLEPPDPDGARVVELACGDGGNLLGVAAARPGVGCLGVDIEPEAIERGRELAATAGLSQVELRATDLLELRADDLGPADYVIVHGLWSWVPEPVREAALRLAAETVRPNGVVSLSYNSLPGWHLWKAPREIARRAAAGEYDADRAAELAVAALRNAHELHGRDDAYGAILAAAADRAAAKSPELLFHDDLEDHCEPFSLEEVVRRAEANGLRYLAEATHEHWWPWRMPPAQAEQIRAAGADAASRQQAADLVTGVNFKTTLFVAADAEPAAEPDPTRLHDLWLSPRPDSPEMPENTAPVVRELFDAACVLGPGPLARTLRELADQTGLEIASAEGAALRLTADGFVGLHLRPPPALGAPGERPRASALARAQAASSDRVATLLHGVAKLDQLAARALLTLLDGTRDREELPAALAALAPEWGFELDQDGFAASLPGVLERFARAGVFEA